MIKSNEKLFGLILIIIITIKISYCQLSDDDITAIENDIFSQEEDIESSSVKQIEQTTTTRYTTNIHSTTTPKNILQNKIREKFDFSEKIDFSEKLLIDNRLDCGVHNISQSEQGSFPWTVAILSNIRKNYLYFVSTGSLIHPKVILTVAHHYQNKSVKILLVRAGDTNLSNDHQINIRQDRSVIKKIIHEDFNPITHENNIALLILEKSFELTENIKPICLTSSMVNINNLQCSISGWCNKCDQNFQLRKSDVSLLQSDKCKSSSEITKYREKKSSFLCTKTCTIDNGSPVICRAINNNLYYQVGMTLSSVHNCKKFKGMSYLNVNEFKSWIKTSLNNSSSSNNHLKYYYLIIFLLISFFIMYLI